MAKLVIVESPAKAKTIKKYLGSGYEVTASMGHVRDLPAARLSVDIKNDFKPTYEIIKGKSALVKELKKAARESDGVYLATDPDREGEAISWHLAHILGLDPESPDRVTFNEITKAGVEHGMENPRKLDMSLVDAQQARRILDRLVGYKLSPFVSQKIRRGLSAGRVQSVAVRLIVDREKEIRAFKPEEYWTVDAKLVAPGTRKTFDASFYGYAGEKKAELKNEAEANAVIGRAENGEWIVQSIKKGTRSKRPSAPFITSTLQQEASRRLGFQSKRTMKVAQELYEGVEVQGVGSVGLITYMRTDSTRLSDQAREQGREYIENTYGEKYFAKKPHFFKSGKNAQDGHEAIRPTMPSLTPEQAKASLTSDQYKLYNLIWRRFMASLMESCIHNTVKANIEVNGCVFTAAGYTVKFDGFTAVYEDLSDEKETQLPALREGDTVRKKELAGNQHFTQPPARYTEASLIKALEENGIGRPSTYAAIISTILARGYVERNQKQLAPTELGEAMTGLLEEHFPKIVDTKFTAGMETKLDDVSVGRQDYIQMLHDFYGDFDQTLTRAKKEMEGVKIKLQEDQTDIPCEKCGRMMVIKTGRFGKFLACPGYPECRNAKPLIQEMPGECPRCGGKIVQKKSHRGHTFYGCGNYPDCNFMTWYMPTEEKCPVCGKTLFKKRANQLICLNEQCSTYVKEEPRAKKAKSDEEGGEKKPAKKAAKKTTSKTAKKAAAKTTKKKAETQSKSAGSAAKKKAKAPETGGEEA